MSRPVCGETVEALLDFSAASFSPRALLLSSDELLSEPAWRQLSCIAHASSSIIGDRLLRAVVIDYAPALFCPDSMKYVSMQRGTEEKA